jgi:hypothetical protein
MGAGDRTMNDISRIPHIQNTVIAGHSFVVAKQEESFGKFVRLKLTGEIVEVVCFDSDAITINFKGHSLVMKHHEVCHLRPDEIKALDNHNSGLDFLDLR